MVAVSLAAGVEVDIASGAELKEHTNSILRGVRADRGQRLRPVQSVSPAATGTYVLILGCPAPGTVWRVQEVVVAVDSASTSPAGATASLWAGTPPNQNGANIDAQPMLGSLMRPAQALPALFPFGGETQVVKDTEYLFVLVNSPAVVMNIIAATASVQQLRSSVIMSDRV